MTGIRPFTQALERLKRHGLRPTRQRLALVRLLFERGDRHVTADQLHAEAAAAGVLREVVVEAGRSYFDTNASEHHHILVEPTGELIDIPASDVQVSAAPRLPEGMALRRMDVILRVTRT